MKSIFFFFALIFVLFTAAFGQSGRRVQTAQQPPVQAPQVQITQSDADRSADDSLGYSESTPNSGRAVLTPRAKKKDTKKEEVKAPAHAETAPAVPSADDGEVIKVETNLVTIPVSVSDRNGFFISNLAMTNFKIFEDGIEQKIEYFGTTDKPFTVVLLIDVSPSTSYQIEEIQAAASAFVRQLLPHDQVMVIEFDSRVNVLTEPTGDREKIHKAISRTGFGDGTSLYDAVDYTLRRKLQKIEGRKAIVLFTDGVDTTSGRSNYTNTIRDAVESEAVIFPIYYNTFLDTVGIGRGGVMSAPPTLGLPGQVGVGTTAQISAAYTKGRAYLAELAGVTGGKLYRADSTPGGLTTAFESIAEELRRQYVLGYYPADTGTAGERKQIRVRVDKPKLVIRTKDSYTVGGVGN